MKYLTFFAAVLFFTGSCFAQIYRWVDENGQVHYSDKKPDNQSFSEVNIDDKVSSYEAVSYSSYTPEITQLSNKSKVVMFSASWCGYCRKAEAYFKKNNIPYTNYDIETNSKGKKLYKQMGATGVPVILVGNKRLNGFSEAAFEHIYK